MNRHEFADMYHRLGINVIPTDGEKRPMLTTWDKWKSTTQSDDDVDSLQWERDGVHGIAGIAGAVSNGLVALDLDGAPGEASVLTLLARLGLERNYRWCVRTPGRGGGWHVWVRSEDLDDELEKAQLPLNAKLQGPWPGAEALELRMRDCYTLLPPSKHPDGRYMFAHPNGSPYPHDPPTLVAGKKLVRLSHWNQTKQSPPERMPSPSVEGEWTAYIARALEDEADIVANAPNGNRNNALNIAAFSMGTLAHAGAQRADVERELLSAAARCGIPEREAWKTFESGWTDGQDSPRSMPAPPIAKESAAPATPPPPPSKIVWLNEAVDQVYDSTVTPLPLGIDWPWPTVNGMVRSLRGGALAVLAGYTSHGKSAAALEVALSAARLGKKVLFVSGEMRPFDLGVRAAQRYGLNSKRLLESCPEESDRDCADVARQDPAHKNIGILYVRNIGQIRTVSLEMHPDLLIVDYLGLLEIGRLSPYAGVTQNSHDLKDIAITQDVPVLVLAQFRRPDRAMRDGEPQLDDLRDSGSIEQDADQVVFVWRKKIEYDQWKYPTFLGDIIVAKARMGSLGKVAYAFDPVRQKFWEDGGEPT